MKLWQFIIGALMLLVTIQGAAATVYYEDHFNNTNYASRWTCYLANLTYDLPNSEITISRSIPGPSTPRGCTYQNPTPIYDTNLQILIRMRQQYQGHGVETWYQRWNTTDYSSDCFGKGIWQNPGGGGDQAFFVNCTDRIANFYTYIGEEIFPRGFYWDELLILNQDTNRVNYSMLYPYPGIATDVHLAQPIKPFGRISIVTETPEITIENICIANNISECTYLCVENWTVSNHLGECISNSQTKTKIYTDLGNCQSDNGLPIDNGSISMIGCSSKYSPSDLSAITSDVIGSAGVAFKGWVPLLIAGIVISIIAAASIVAYSKIKKY